jgi:hypothetical protein
MAKMRPKNFPKNPEDHYSESITFEAFSKLSSDWTVLYSYRWHGKRKGRTGDGEADFLLIHPLHGFFIAEVKGGSAIKYEDGIFFQKSKGTWKKMTTGPFEQGVISKNEINRYLNECIEKRTYPNLPNFVPNFGHFVVFPSAIEKTGFPPEGGREIIMDSDDMINVEKRLLEIVFHWNNNRDSDKRNSISRENVEAIIGALRPYKETIERVSQDLSKVKNELLALTKAQSQILNNIESVSVIKGAAGTGKTTLATERARDLAEQGLNTLFLCFNRPLSDHLNREMSNKPGKLTIATLHSFAKKVCDMGQIAIDQNDFNSLIENFPFAAMSLGISFDAIIIDEAQDFSIGMWQSLTDFIDSGPNRENLVFNIFLDSNQNIYEGSGWEIAIGKYSERTIINQLFVNCRNTTEIGSLVKNFGGSHLFLGASGPEPFFITCEMYDQIPIRLKQEIQRLRKDFGFNAKDFTVLTSNRRLASNLEDRFAEEEEIDGLSCKEVIFQTIKSFKGLESPCVIAVFESNDLDDNGDVLSISEFEKLSYIGLSRAQLVLSVIGTKDQISKIKTGNVK